MQARYEKSPKGKEKNARRRAKPGYNEALAAYKRSWRLGKKLSQERI